MRGLSVVALFLACSAPGMAQTPAVSAVVNAASNLPPGLPNGGIAQGALMILYGTGLGPATLVSVSAYPLPATLAPGNQRKVAALRLNIPLFRSSDRNAAELM